jgi:TIR domain
LARAKSTFRSKRNSHNIKALAIPRYAMLDKLSGRIFISYSRKDGAAFAQTLRDRLIGEGFSIWQDIVTLEGGRDWWSQIEDALKSKALQHFVFVVTPAALASPVVRREIRLARQEGKTVCPVKGPGLADLGTMPRWLGQIYDVDLPEHYTTDTGLARPEPAEARRHDGAGPACRFRAAASRI